MLRCPRDEQPRRGREERCHNSALQSQTHPARAIAQLSTQPTIRRGAAATARERGAAPCVSASR
eukprot:7834-Chlamydomonas_euryale.AAC.1